MKIKNKIKKCDNRKQVQLIIDKNSYYNYLIEINLEDGLKIKEILDKLKIKFNIVKVKYYKF